MSKEKITALEDVTRGTNKFAISLYQALVSNQTGNVFVSPLSVQMVLALAYTGAKGDTAEELSKLLSLPDKIENTLIGYNKLIQGLQDPVLKLANRIFLEATAGVKKEFQANAEKYFLSPAESVDFCGETEKTRESINCWVEEQTNNKITNVLPPGSVNSDTSFILLNAIYFKANWCHKFLEADTKEQPFYIDKTNTMPVQMMNLKNKFDFIYDNELKAKLLDLKYEGENFHMLIILPDEIDGLQELEGKMGTVNISEMLNNMGRPSVIVALPKFKMEETMDLNEVLKSMGAQSMFSNQTADFGGLSDERLVVSKVVQKSFVEVNEVGTEAAAVTRMQLLKKSAPRPPKEFLVDHPFIFLIMFKDIPLFFGRFVKPPQ